MNSPINDDRNLYTVFKYGRTQQLYCKWTAEEDMLLRDAVSKFGTRKWTCVSNQIPGRTAIQCSTRWMGTLNSNIHKGKWSKEESKALYDAVEFYQKLSDSHQDQQQLPWNLVAENVPCRNGIQCQARWTETLDPSIRKGRWSADEDRLLHDAKKKYGCCWVRVATMIPTRTQRQCRTRWNQIHSHRKRKIQKTYNLQNNLKYINEISTSHYVIT
ncbi:hypothetical protein K501DRAFT_296211 [Backusella circina FSU 941]|nr:hypothetical protein K501DRAFT_296211 [Backusella circina FSU 941]